MRIKLTNIGMLENADVKLDGLTVIAGENDTGKSTLGKTLFALIKADNIAEKKEQYEQKEALAKMLNMIFDGNISNNGSITLQYDSQNVKVEIENKDNTNFVDCYDRPNQNHSRPFFDATFIQSPIVFDLIDFFDGVNTLKVQREMEEEIIYEISYPYVLWDLYRKISKKNSFPKAKSLQLVSEIIQKTIGGEFKKEGQKFSFYKYFTGRVLQIEIANTAFGIKSFGILQLLNNNGFLDKKYVLILDEPEVHLHPAWQLKYAEIIAQLTKSGICVVVNSHSPYMIEALKVYSDKEGIGDKTNFYLAEKNTDGIMSKIIDCTNNLMRIFDLLSKPLSDLEKIDLENSFR